MLQKTREKNLEKNERGPVSMCQDSSPEGSRLEE